MKIFYDCEFVERGRELPIQLVSIGLVREDGAELYAINEESLSTIFRNPWTAINLPPQLPIQMDDPTIFQWDAVHPEYRFVLALDRLADEVRRFITEVSDVELWAYYSAYDHVALCQLFGSMAELPSGIPMWTHDLMQLHEQHRVVPLPPEPENLHHAMADARWVRDAYNRISKERFIEHGVTPDHSFIVQPFIELPKAHMQQHVVDAAVIWPEGDVQTNRIGEKDPKE